MTTLYAQPFDISAIGFYFETEAEFREKAVRAINAHGQPVEEFEIQFIDGDTLDAQLFVALSVHQGDVGAFLEGVADWSDDDKTRVIIAVGECGHRFQFGKDEPSQFDIDLYECDSLRALAMQFVEEGLFGDIPDRIQCYLDYDRIARDLSMDYSEITINTTSYVYRCC